MRHLVDEGLTFATGAMNAEALPTRASATHAVFMVNDVVKLSETVVASCERG